MGEDVTLRVRITNDKRTPLPIVRLLVRFPFSLLPEATPNPTALRGHRRRLSIAGRSEVELRLPVVVTTRGEVAVRDGKFVGTVGRGQFLERPTT